MTSRHRLSRHTFPKAHEGSRLASPHFSVNWGSSPLLGGCAVVVPKKVARRSVDRHLLKRRVLEILRPWSAHDRFIVVYARTGSASLSFTVLTKEITGLLMKTKLPVAQ